VPTSVDVRPAVAEAARLLDLDSDRWRHVVGVGGRAESIAHTLSVEDRQLLISAAWLHDIGYAPALHDTGLHSLDGARYLRSIGASPRLCRLVAHHTASIVEAESRGLADTLEEEFPIEYCDVADALTYVDMTTGPQGQPMHVRERLAEILQRYPRDHVVHQSILRAGPSIVATVTRVERRLQSVQPR
jgi:putative nucleotidyltransferase with HDIG domain